MISDTRRAWATVITMTLCIGFTVGGLAGFGVFVKPLLQYFGGSRAFISTITTVALLCAASSAVLAGWLVDRFEIKWVVAGGVGLAGAAYLLASQSHQFSAILLSYALLGVSISLAGVIPLTVLVKNWFVRGRAFAFSVGVTGIAVGPLLVTYVATLAFHFRDWRWGFGVLGAICLLVILPLALTFIRTAPRRARPTSPIFSDAQADPAAGGSDGASVGEALRGRSFWLLALVFAAYGIAATGVAFHLIAFLTDRGFTMKQAALAVTGQLVSAGLGKPAFGALSDRFGVKPMLAAGLLILASGLVGYCLVDGLAAAIFFCSLFGLGAAAIPVLVPLLQLEALGPRRLGSLSSLLQMVQTLAASVGGVVAGRVFDVYGSYLPLYLPLAIFIAACSLAPFLMAPFGERGRPSGARG